MGDGYWDVASGILRSLAVEQQSRRAAVQALGCGVCGEPATQEEILVPASYQFGDYTEGNDLRVVYTETVRFVCDEHKIDAVHENTKVRREMNEPEQETTWQPGDPVYPDQRTDTPPPPSAYGATAPDPASDEEPADAAELGRLTSWLHSRRLHPQYEYAATKGQRKAWDDQDTPPAGDGWERNTTLEDPEGWERFAYHEESYWRRLRPVEPALAVTYTDQPTSIVSMAAADGLVVKNCTANWPLVQPVVDGGMAVGLEQGGEGPVRLFSSYGPGYIEVHGRVVLDGLAFLFDPSSGTLLVRAAYAGVLPTPVGLGQQILGGPDRG